MNLKREGGGGGMIRMRNIYIPARRTWLRLALLLLRLRGSAWRTSRPRRLSLPNAHSTSGNNGSHGVELWKYGNPMRIVTLLGGGVRKLHQNRVKNLKIASFWVINCRHFRRGGGGLPSTRGIYVRRGKINIKGGWGGGGNDKMNSIKAMKTLLLS